MSNRHHSEQYISHILSSFQIMAPIKNIKTVKVLLSLLYIIKIEWIKRRKYMSSIQPIITYN